MLKDILPLIPKHSTYTESFAGGAAVLFAKEPVNINVINDLNGEVINFYRTIVGDFDALKSDRTNITQQRATPSSANN